MQDKQKELSPEHQLFVHAYIKHTFNATKAYQEVYQCDEESARRSGARLLTNVDIKESIGKELDAIMADKRELSHRVINELEKIAFSDVKHFIDPQTGKITCTEETDSAALESVQFDETKVDGKTMLRPKYKMHNKVNALKALSVYVCGFSEKHKVEHSGQIIYLDKQDENI